MVIPQRLKSGLHVDGWRFVRTILRGICDFFASIFLTKLWCPIFGVLVHQSGTIDLYEVYSIQLQLNFGYSHSSLLALH